MANFCPECGSPLQGASKFCPSCGKRISDFEKAQSSQRYPDNMSQTQVYHSDGFIRTGIPAPGFSDRTNDPEILAAIKRNKRASKLFLFFLVPVPIIGFIIYGLLSEEMDIDTAALIGGTVSAVFLVCAFVSFIHQRVKKTYDAIVIDKKSEWTYVHKNSSDNRQEMVYTTVVQTNEGKKRKIIERGGSQVWAFNYLNVGDRFRYHPQFSFPYEHYDKSKAPYICCVSCGTKNPVEADRCKNCGLPLLK